MGRPKLNSTENTETTETPKKEFGYIPYTGSESLPPAKTDKKGKFIGYGEPRFAYRRTSATTVEFLAYYRKPQGVVSKLARVLKLRSGKNKDDAFFRLLKDNKFPEVD